MSRKFKTPDYGATLHQTINLSESLPPNHLASCVVDVISQLDLSEIYQHYIPTGSEALAYGVLLGSLFYGCATGLFRSRKFGRVTCGSIRFRFVAGGWYPDHDTIAHFRKTFLAGLHGYLCKSCFRCRRLTCCNRATSAMRAARFMPMPPRVMP